MTRSPSGLYVAALGLVASGWIIREVIARWRLHAGRVVGQNPWSAAGRATWPSDPEPRGLVPPLEPLPVQGTRWVPERRSATGAGLVPRPRPASGGQPDADRMAGEGGPGAAADDEDAWW